MTGTLQRSGCRVDAWFQCSLESAGVSQPVPLYVAMQADMVFVVWFVGFYSALLLFGPCVDLTFFALPVGKTRHLVAHIHAVGCPQTSASTLGTAAHTVQTTLELG